jgi:GNAT superfamily N-acetyltransferase
MAQNPVSLESLGDRVGDAAARHLVGAFKALAARVPAPTVTRTGDVLRVVTGAMHPFGNLVVGLAADDVAGLEEAVGPLAALAAPALVIYPDPEVSPAVVARLAELGFERHDPMPAMAVDVDALATTSLPAGFEMRRVETADEARAWVETLSVGYEIPPEVAAVFSPEAHLEDPSLAFYSAVRKGEVIATSCFHFGGGVAGVYCVATRPDWRGRGLGAHVTAEPLRIARRDGWRVGVLQSSPSGHGVYRRLGFADVAEVQTYVRIPAG